MKICWIKVGGFVPLDYGGRIRSYHMVRELARRHEVTVVTFYPRAADDQHHTIAREFKELITVPLDLPKPRSAGEYLNYAQLLFAPDPYSMQKYYSPEVRRTIAELFRRERFDAVICDFIFPAGVVDWKGPAPVLLFTHNVEAEVWERQYKVAKNWLMKLMYWLEYRRLTAAEAKYAKLAAHVLAVSDSNCRFFGRYTGGAENVTLLPTGVDTEFFRPAPSEEREGALVFTGSMDWLPNDDAMQWFYRDILPHIRAEEPGVETWMIGRNPTGALRNLVDGDDRVHLTGRVDDVRPFMNRGSVYVLPMRSGSGTRLKVFEAMAAGKAMVSTRTGAEGLPVTHGENILLADDPLAFARHVVELLRSPELRRRLGSNARSLAERVGSWKSATDRLDEALHRVVSSVAVPQNR
jgi:polysaccharide biosynthesis protein PslH